jgi:hypothetical protein
VLLPHVKPSSGFEIKKHLLLPKMLLKKMLTSRSHRLNKLEYIKRERLQYSKEKRMYECARTLAIVATAVISITWHGVAHGNDSTLPMSGLFYGIDGPIDKPGNSIYRYRNPIGYRFEAEMDGSIVAVRWNNRYNHFSSDSGYSQGNGGLIVLEIRRNDPSIEYPPSNSDPMAPLPQSDPNLLGKSAIKGPATHLGTTPSVALTNPVPVVAGQRYWLVFQQLDRSQYVSINSAYIDSPIPTSAQGPGGPYYGDAPHIARAKNGNWQHYDGTHAEESRHLVFAQFLYRLRDGREIWSGFGSFSASGRVPGPRGSLRAFNAAQPIRQRFVPSWPTFSTSKLYLRAYRAQGQPTPGSLDIELSCNSAPVGRWSVPASNFPLSKVAPPPDGAPPYPPIHFVGINLGRQVLIQRGMTCQLELSTGSGSYYIHAQQTDKPSFTSRNVFRDGWAEYSTNGGGSWQGWHLGGKTARKDMVLPFMFEVLP